MFICQTVSHVMLSNHHFNIEHMDACLKYMVKIHSLTLIMCWKKKKKLGNEKQGDKVRDILKAMPEPSPAKTKMRTEMNSARAALRASGCPNSAGFPIAILETGILGNLDFDLIKKAL